MERKKFKVTFIDSKSNGQKKSCYYHAPAGTTVQYVIDFFGLNSPDVLWYDVEIV